MQSQQKRVKWSRGETAEALEERTDTGVTQASVELMENCIPDIYGNISRRPAIVPIPVDDNIQGNPFFSLGVHHVIPFYYTENDYFLLGFGENIEILRIQNKTITQRYTITNPDNGFIRSYAQQNNMLVFATDTNIYQFRIDISGNNVVPSIEPFVFSAGWYAPNGTQTAQVTQTEVTGMNFDASSVGSYTYTESNGETTVYSWISTGIAAASVSGTWTGATTSYYGHQQGTDGSGYHWIDTSPTGGTVNTGPVTLTNGTTYVNGQQVGTFVFKNLGTDRNYPVYVNVTGDARYLSCAYCNNYDVSSMLSAPTAVDTIQNYIPIGCIVQFPVNGAYMRVEGYDSDGTNLRMYGSFLTPIADANAHDTRVKVETGYVSLQPASNTSYPHPKKLVFSEQRLWAGAWQFNSTEEYALTVGSQIARYTDFKNNYNQENEPITLDILTQYKEKIVHLIDYNGLKILTDSYEYAYEKGGAVKQSSNGSLESCEPIIFDSLCLYADITGKQIKAMQYELQSDIFNSSTINQYAPHDLVWYPVSMASYEDKVYSTGKYLFVVNKHGTQDTYPELAVCNFVPANQANIWSRWVFPKTPILGQNVSRLDNIVYTKNDVIFLMYADYTLYINASHTEGLGGKVIVPMFLDFNGLGDYETELTNNQVILSKYVASNGNIYKSTLNGVDVDVYSNGIYAMTTTTSNLGYITADISGLTNVKVGFRINSTVRSHPIDVGGKTKSIKKRIGKTVMSVRDTEPDAIVINDKTGYMNPQGDKICFYGVTGMKDEIKYTLTNKNGAMFHLESLLMNIEYGTLDS